jgi:hypothetical protein
MRDGGRGVCCLSSIRGLKTCANPVYYNQTGSGGTA